VNSCGAAFRTQTPLVGLRPECPATASDDPGERVRSRPARFGRLRICQRARPMIASSCLRYEIRRVELVAAPLPSDRPGISPRQPSKGQVLLGQVGGPVDPYMIFMGWCRRPAASANHRSRIPAAEPGGLLQVSSSPRVLLNSRPLPGSR